jgi:hypothetical protein
MANAPYIPAKDALFAAWLLNFSTLLTASPVTYGLTAPDAVTVAGVNGTFQAAYATATNPATRTSGAVAAKDVARLDAEAIVRPLAVNVSLNPAVDDSDKVDLGVTVRTLIPTPVPAPVTAPQIAVQSAIPLQQTLTYKEAGAAGKYKPPGVVGVEIFRSVGIAPAVDPSVANYVGQVTKSPFRQTFVSGDQGKVVTYFARWVTRSGPQGIAQPGPWSAPLALTVM